MSMISRRMSWRQVVRVTQPEPPAVPIGVVRRCLNCGAALTGRYCANCSQAGDVHVPSTGEILHEALEGITHSDSRLWTTLRMLWFVPGKLTQEFLAGRRAAYLPPFRLYLVLSIIFFLVASLSPMRAEFVHFDNPSAGVSAAPPDCGKLQLTLYGRDFGPRLKHMCGEIARDNGANLLHVAISTMPKAMFIFLPLVALLHMLLYWRPRHRYAEHLVFFLHAHAFFFAMMTAVVLLSDAETWPVMAKLGSLAPLLLWSLPLYTVLAMKRVFGRSWKATLAKAFALFAVYMVVLSITMGGVFLYAVLQL